MTRRIEPSSLRFAAALCVMAAACAPPKPRILFLPPSVTVDSGARVRRPATIATKSRTFWEAMSNLDTGFVSRHEVTETQRAFAHAVGLIMSGDHDAAALSLDAIRKTSPDDLVRTASRILMTSMLQYQDNWDALATMSLEVRRDPAENEGKAEVESWAAAFKGVAPRSVSYPSVPVVLPLTLSPTGTPTIPVSINGKVRFLWLDTGSSMSILASDVALDLGVNPLVDDTLEVATATGRVAARPAAIARLDIGAIRLDNFTAMIVAAELMQLRIGDGSDPTMSMKIDGVIGFDVIRRLDIRIDYVNRRVTLLAPARDAPSIPGGRNLYWIGMPVVRMITSKGIPLHFHLDTGAQETYSTDGLIEKTNARTFSGERRLVGGFGGLTIAKGRFVNELRATTGGQPIVLRKLLVFAPAHFRLVSLDGILGSDVGKAGVVRIDATNGVFQLEAAPTGRGLPPGS
jgi:hypothetical protein